MRRSVDASHPDWIIDVLGAIAGDVIGSIYEHRPIKTKQFPLFQQESRFTDDTVLTIAIADAILHEKNYRDTLKNYTRQYPNAGYGGNYWKWAHSDQAEPYYSWGNGSAMRVSPVGFAYEPIETVLQEAERSAAVTHNHPEGVKGAQATALAVYLARSGVSRSDIRAELQRRFDYDLQRRLEEIRSTYTFDVSCQGSVPEALISFLESNDYEDTIRNAISLGGDSDTLACIAGGVASAFYGGLPDQIAVETRRRLPDQFLEVIDEFQKRFINR